MPPFTLSCNIAFSIRSLPLLVKNQIPVSLFSSIAFSIRSLPLLIKSKSPLSLFFSIAFSVRSLSLLRQNQILPFTLSSTVLLSPLDPSHYSVKTILPRSLPVFCPFFRNLSSCLLPPPFPSFPVLLSLLGPSHYPVKPHYAHYKQFQIQKLHVHLDDVNKKNYYMTRAYIVHVQ